MGNAGSGKTTLAFQLQAKLTSFLCIILIYTIGCQAGSASVLRGFQELQTELCEKDEWIIEGAYIGARA